MLAQRYGMILADNGSPWYIKGRMLLSAQFTIGALMKNLDASSSGQILGYRDAAEHILASLRRIIAGLLLAAALPPPRPSLARLTQLTGFTSFRMKTRYNSFSAASTPPVSSIPCRQPGRRQ